MMNQRISVRGAIEDAFRFLLLSGRERLRRQSLLAITGVVTAVYGDVVKPVQHAMPLGVLTSAVAGAVALCVIAVFARSNPLTRLPEGARGRQLRQVHLPVRVERSRDLAELALICCALFLATWGGERVFAARSTADDVSADSVSLFATLIPQLERLRSDVAGVRSDVAGVRNDVQAVQTTLGRVKKETSDDPRKELANIGVTWSGDAFLEAVRTGDLRVVSLFVAGEIPMTSAVSQGRPLPVMLALNVTNPGPVLDVLERGGLDINHTYEVAAGIGRVKVSLLGRAIEKGNVALVQALLGHHVDVNAAIQTFGVIGAPQNTFALASAVSWRQMEIAFLLLDNGADPRVGDFAGYREANSLLERRPNDPSLTALKTLMVRLAPAGADAARIGDELRLQAVERELTDVALEELRAMRGTSQQVELNRRYDALQRERKALQERLGLTAQGRQ
jgi:hypothetical protein